MQALLTYGILMVAVTLAGQSGVNPFDIAGRAATSAATDTAQATQAASSSTNVFDVSRTGLKVNEAATQSTTYPVASTLTDTLKQKVPSTTSLVTEAEVVSTLGDNPFEVSHIPIRRSKLKKEADAFTSQNTRLTTSSGNNSSDIFIFWFVFLAAILLAVVINTKRGIITSLTKSILNENMLKYNYREQNGGVGPQYLLLYIGYFINAGTLAYLVVSKYTDMSGLRIFLYCVAAVVVAYFAKHMMLTLLGVVFPIRSETSLYGFAIESFNIFLGIVLIPLNLIIAFGPKGLASIFLYVAIAVVLLVLLARSFRGLVIGATFAQSHIFHFFLYLCAFELVPVILLVQLVQ